MALFFSVGHFYSLLDIQKQFVKGRYWEIVAFGSTWLLCLWALICIGSIRNFWIKLSFLLLIFISVLLSDLSQVMIGSQFNDDTLDLFWNARFSSDAFFETYWLQFIKAVLKAALLPSILLFCSFKLKIRQSFICICPLLAILSCFIIFQQMGGVGYRVMPTQFSSIAALLGWLAYPDPVVEKAEVQIELIKAPEIQHLLLIVDESVRGDYLDLNGAQGVTPFLKSIEDRIVNFGIAVSGNNCTATSNAILRMGFNPSMPAENSDNIKAHPTVWKYAKKAGYKTIFVDNQRINGQLQNYMDEAEVKLIDQIHQYSLQTARKNRDLASINLITEYQQSKEKTFIYMNKAGAHFHYEKSYPDDWHIFKPHLLNFEPALNREKMINSYKNAVLWSVDHFFEKLLSQLDLKNTLVLYTSDHGQNLLDDGSPITHCQAENPHQNEAIVPLFVVTENQELLLKFKQAAALNYNQASHFQIFPTLLEIFGFDQNMVEKTYYLNLFSKMQSPPGFVSTKLIKKFGSKAKWDRLNWHKVDF